MRVVLDTCVLFPTLMRQVILTFAKSGAFDPVWSPRILEEWRRAVASKFPDQVHAVEGEITMLAVHWPTAQRQVVSDLNRFWLPDPNDVHVLALAVDSSADAIMTINRKDFPKFDLAEFGLDRLEPDGFLTQCFAQNPDRAAHALEDVVKDAQAHHPQMTARAIFKKARLPRLGKALDAAWMA